MFTARLFFTSARCKSLFCLPRFLHSLFLGRTLNNDTQSTSIWRIIDAHPSELSKMTPAIPGYIDVNGGSRLLVPPTAQFRSSLLESTRCFIVKLASFNEQSRDLQKKKNLTRTYYFKITLQFPNTNTLYKTRDQTTKN